MKSEKPQVFRDYRICRDASGMPTSLVWRGDRVIETVAPETREEVERGKLADWEELYGKQPKR